jgi:hypothetical protein
MIAKIEERITIIELIGEVDRMFKIYRDTTSKKVTRSLSDENNKKNLLVEEISKQSSNSVGEVKEKSQKWIYSEQIEGQTLQNNIQKHAVSR